MDSKRKQAAITDVFFSKIFFVISVSMLGLVSVGLIRGALKNAAVGGDIRDLQQHIASVSRENEEFTQLVAFLQSPEFVEQEAKLKLGLKKEGEGVVIIPDTTFETAQQSIQAQDTRSNPRRWLEYFTGTH